MVSRWSFLPLLVILVGSAAAQGGCPAWSTLTSTTGRISGIIILQIYNRSIWPCDSTVGEDSTVYSSQTSCLWLIDLSGASPPVTNINFEFTRLDTEYYYDYVAFFNGNFTDYAFRAYSGQPQPLPPVFSSTGPIAGIWFAADEAISFGGFTYVKSSNIITQIFIHC